MTKGHQSQHGAVATVCKRGKEGKGKLMCCPSFSFFLFVLFRNNKKKKPESQKERERESKKKGTLTGSCD